MCGLQWWTQGCSQLYWVSLLSSRFYYTAGSCYLSHKNPLLEIWGYAKFQSYLFPPLPVKELLLLGLEVLLEFSHAVCDTSLTAQILWLVAEPGLSCADVRVVALRLLGRSQTDVTGSRLGEAAWAKDALEVNPVWLFDVQPLQHSNSLTWMNQCHLKKKSLVMFRLIC